MPRIYVTLEIKASTLHMLREYSVQATSTAGHHRLCLKTKQKHQQLDGQAYKSLIKTTAPMLCRALRWPQFTTFSNTHTSTCLALAQRGEAAGLSVQSKSGLWPGLCLFHYCSSAKLLPLFPELSKINKKVTHTQWHRLYRPYARISAYRRMLN